MAFYLTRFSYTPETWLRELEKVEGQQKAALAEEGKKREAGDQEMERKTKEALQAIYIWTSQAWSISLSAASCRHMPTNSQR